MKKKLIGFYVRIVNQKQIVTFFFFSTKNYFTFCISLNCELKASSFILFFCEFLFVHSTLIITLQNSTQKIGVCILFYCIFTPNCGSLYRFNNFTKRIIGEFYLDCFSLCIHWQTLLDVYAGLKYFCLLLKKYLMSEKKKIKSSTPLLQLYFWITLDNPYMTHYYNWPDFIIYVKTW